MSSSTTEPVTQETATSNSQPTPNLQPVSNPQPAPHVQLIPRLTRFLTILLISTTTLANIPKLGKSITENFALLPVATVGQSKLWNVVTAGFLDTNIITGLLNVGLFFNAARWIEASWGSRPLIFYLLVVNTLASIATYIIMLAAYVVTRVDTFFFTPIGTTNGICCALLIAIKQLIPNHEIGAASMSITANYLPVIYVLICVLLTVLTVFPIGVLIFTLTAAQAAWLYLRYLRYANGTYGDVSDTFAYPTLFPTSIRYPVSIVSNIAFLLFKPLITAVQSSPESSKDNSSAQQPSTASAIDTERRRQRALKVLDERMQAASVSEPTPNEDSQV